jgi:hypothetical protein
VGPELHWEVAAAVKEKVLGREKANLAGFGVFGSVPRGDARRFSDLDVLFVVKRRKARTRPEVVRGVLVTYHHLTVAEAREEVSGSGPWLNDALGGWRSLKPLYDPTGLLRRLKRRAARPKAAQFDESARRDLLETYEDLGKLRNAMANWDREEAREMALWFTGAAAGSLLDLERHVTSTGRRMFIEARRLGTAGQAIWRLRYEDLPLPRMSVLADRIWRELLARARDRRIAIPGLLEDEAGQRS